MLGLMFFCFGIIRAQESVNSGGNDAFGTGGSMAYTFGQVAYTNQEGTSGIVQQGVQHAYEIYSIGVINEELSYSLTLFPNPTVDAVTLKINEEFPENLRLELFDLNGKKVMNKQITDSLTLIDMSGFAPSVYILHVINSSQKVQSFKIIKK